MAEQDRDPDLRRLGRELRGLTPRPCPIDRDAVMFRAGQASVPRRWLWPLLTVLAAGLAVMFAAALFVQPTHRQDAYSPPIYVPSRQPFTQGPAPVIPDDTPAPGSEDTATAQSPSWLTPDTRYHHAQQDLLRWGLDGVPLPPTTTIPPPAEQPEMLLRSF